MPGLGPLGARASTVRPASDADAYGTQTWFTNCSAPGASDGTVPTASWFNHILAQFVYAAGQASVTLTNDQTNDTFLWQIISNAITAKIGAATPPWGV